MRFNPKARLDRGGWVTPAAPVRGGAAAAGRASPPACRSAAASAGVLVLVVDLRGPRRCSAAAGATGATAGRVTPPSTAASGTTACEFGSDANESADCVRVAVENSLLRLLVRATLDADYASDRPKLVTFSGSVQTGCGTASSAVGPFYCPRRPRRIYLDTSFFDEVPRAPARRAGRRVRRGLRPRPRVRPPRPERSSAPWAGSRPSRAPRATPSGWSCRPTATPGCGRGPPRPREDADGQTLVSGAEPGGHATSRSPPRRRSATTGSSSSPAAASTPTRGRTDRRKERVAWFLKGYQKSGSLDACDTSRGGAV